VLASRHARLTTARLYLVCDAINSTRLESALRGGVDLVQLRMKDAGDAEILEAAARFKTLAAEYGALFLLNDRPDLAVEADADGVHVGQDDTSVDQARREIGPDRILGLSTHTAQDVDSVRSDTVDYIGVGPVFATPTKPGRLAVGPGLVEYAAANAQVPFFAIGGLDQTNLDQVVRAGAERIAVVRAIADAADPERAAHALRAQLEVGVGAA
jgi:thiamine-phosphate pyrophosphorylase